MKCSLFLAAAVLSATPAIAGAQYYVQDEAASGCLLVNTPVSVGVEASGRPVSALRAVSLFAIAPIEPRTYAEHDLVQIIVRESSQANSSQDLNTKKKNDFNAEVTAWPNLNYADLINGQLYGGRTDHLPAVALNFDNKFDGNADYQRKDELTARVTAEVVEVLPNGNLVLEAKTSITLDKEIKIIRITGICRPDDITPANTVLSNQIHDLNYEEQHKGDVKDAGSKGIISKILEIIFAF